MMKIASNINGLGECYPDVYLECIAISGSMGCKMDEYVKACLARETHLINHSVNLIRHDEESQHDYYAAEILHIKSHIAEERLIYLLQQSQSLLQGKIDKQNKIIVIASNSLSQNSDYTKNLMQNVWRLGNSAISQYQPEFIIPEISVLHSLSHYINIFHQQPLDEVIIGAVDSLVTQRELSHRLLNNNIMSKENPDKKALGEGAVWLRLVKYKLPHMSKIEAISEFYSASVYASSDQRHYYQKCLSKLMTRSNLIGVSINNIVCMGHHGVDEMKELRMLQEFVSRTYGESPKIIGVNSICGDMGCATNLFQLALADSIIQKSDKHKATMLWENSLPDTRGIVLLTPGGR